MSLDRLPEFQFDEKEKTIRVRRPATPIHWGVVVNFILGVLGAATTYAVLTGPMDRPLTPYTVVLSVFGGFLLVFVTMSFIALIIAYRFGYRGDWTLTSIILYLASTVAILIAMWLLF